MSSFSLSLKYITLFTTILLSNFLYAEEKSSKEIQLEINQESSRIKNLQDEINRIEGKINKNIKDEKEIAEIIVELEMQISLTNRLIRAISTEEILIKKAIQKIDSEIIDKEQIYDDLKSQLADRAIYLYKNNNRQSNLENLILSGDWNESMYKMKYLTTINKHERMIRDSISIIIEELSDSKTQKQIALQRKKQLKIDKIAENRRLTKNKKSRDKYLGNLKSNSIKLKKEMNSKESMIAGIESTIKKLYQDKEKSKKIEMELARIRSKKNINPKGNFSSMKGKLSWPVGGKVISKFGNQRNSKTKTITFNPYIEIQSQINSSVSSVLDGMVSKISYIPSFGSIIIVDHGGGYITVYSNLDDIIVNENDYIQTGQKIAVVSSKDSQLQFQIYYNGEPSNPEHWLRRK